MNSSDILVDSAKHVYRDVEDISATTEELSAGMEETAVSTQEMNASSLAISDEVKRVSEMALMVKMSHLILIPCKNLKRKRYNLKKQLLKFTIRQTRS